MNDPLLEENREPLVVTDPLAEAESSGSTPSPAASSNLVSRKWLIAFIGLCGLGFFIADILTPICFRTPFLALLCIGVITAQLTVICVWGTLVHGTLLVRLPWTFLLLVLSWCGFVLGIHLYPGTYGPDATIEAAITWIFGFVVSFIPLKIAALCFGWQIVQSRTADPSNRRDSRYSIADMMIGTLLIALSLGIVRAILPVTGINLFEAMRSSLFNQAEGLTVITIFSVVSLLVKLPCIWISLGEQRSKVLSRIGIWIVYCLGLAIAEIVLLNLLLGAPGGDVSELYAGIILSHQLMGAVMLLVCLALRGLGYRIERSLRARPKESEPNSKEPNQDEIELVSSP